MITLQPITWDNIGDVIDLEMHDSQENFLAPNVFGIAQAYYCTGICCLGGNWTPANYPRHHVR
ncbi:MAG: hypothetical protein FWD97_01370 [Defluviitaleaceae bacterium]|nr:hypothetical protein [Defluviitaleaceae bacterium]